MPAQKSDAVPLKITPDVCEASPHKNSSENVQPNHDDLENLQKIQSELNSLKSKLPSSPQPGNSGLFRVKDKTPIIIKTDSGQNARQVALTSTSQKSSITFVNMVTLANSVASCITNTVPGGIISTTGTTLPTTLMTVPSTQLQKTGKHQLLIMQKPSNTVQALSAAVVTAASSEMTMVASSPTKQTVKAIAVNSSNPSTVKGTTDVKVIFPNASNVAPVAVVPAIQSVSNSTAGGTVTTANFRRPGAAPGSGQVITKVIISNPVTNQQTSVTPFAVSSASGTVPLSTVISPVGGQSSQQTPQQPHTILLASPPKPVTVSKPGVSTQHIIRGIPMTPPKQVGGQGVYVLSPVKTSGKVAVIPVSVAKSPQRIAPAPATMSVAGSRVTIVTASVTSTTSTVTTTTAKAPMIQVPKMNLVLRPTVALTTKTTTTATQSGQASGTISTSAVPLSPKAVAQIATTGTSAGTTPVQTVQSIQVPGSKFHYVRLVSAPAQGTSAPAAKQTTLIPVTPSRPLAPSVTSVTTTPVVTAVSQASGSVRLTVPIAPAISTQHQVINKTSAPTQRVLIPASAVTSVGQIRPATTVAQTPTALGQLPPGTLISTGAAGMQSFVMVPAQYVAQLQQGTQVTAGTRMVLQPASTSNILPAPVPATSLPSQQSGFIPIAAASPTATSQTFDQSNIQTINEPPPVQMQRHQVNGTSSESSDSRPRKPCNCTKSECLKLYCDCFANGEFCNNCNCCNCSNNLDNEEKRQKAIRACLDRNPLAFHPKIGKGRDGDQERRHTKGCNCKRSGCLKNYCECYEAKILCTSLCKCMGCKNFEDSSERKTLMHLADAAEVRVQQQAAAKTKISSQIQDFPTRPPMISTTGERLPFSFITQEVVEATCQCLLAQAEEGEKARKSRAEIEKAILEEFGQCLLAIIECANKTKGQCE